MRTLWSTLIVLVLLAPFGGVGITTTPAEAEVIAAPRTLTQAPGKLRELAPDDDLIDPALLVPSPRPARATSPRPSLERAPTLVSVVRPSPAAPRAPPV